MAGKARRRGSLLLPLVLVAAGIVLLLSNLGLIQGVNWQDVFRFWPVLLIVAGVDLIVGRASVANALAVLLVSCLFLGAAFVAFHAFAPDSWVTRTQTVRYAARGLSSAEITIACDSCDVSVSADAPNDTLIAGEVELRPNDQLLQSYERRDDHGRYALSTRDRLPFNVTGERDNLDWTLQLPDAVELRLAVSADRAANLDLRGLRLTHLDLDCGPTGGTVYLPEESTLNLVVSGRNLTFFVPDTLGIEVRAGETDDVTVPDDYTQVDGGYRSADFEQSVHRATLVLQSGSSPIHIQPLAGETSD